MIRLALAIFLLFPTLAFAQSQRNPCFINVNGGCTPVGTNDPLPVDATVTATANTVAKATAVAPTYVEGSTDSLSMDLNGGLRVSGSINAVSAATATVAPPTYVEGTSNPISQNLSGDTRTIAKQSGAWSVTANAGNNLNTSLLALESGGNLASLVAQIGDVVTNPTANTVLARLKSINDTLGTTLDVNCVSGCSGGGGGGTSSNFNSTFPTAGTAIGLSDGTDMVPALADVSGNMRVSLGASLPAGSNAIGSITNTTFDIGSITTLPSLPTGSNTIGAISNTAFGATQSGTWNINNISGTITLPTNASSASNQTDGSQKSQIVDGAGNVIASTGNALNVAITSGGGSGGTASNFGDPFPAAGTAAGMSQGGNMVALTGTSGNLNVQCANCSGSGASAVDEAAFTAGTSVLAPGGGFYQTTATNNALTDGEQGMWQMTAQRAGFVNLRNSSGTEIGTAVNPVRVDPTGTTTQPISGTVTTNVGSGTRAVSIASAQVASGAFSSGALASGSIAAGAQVDLLTMRGTKNAGAAAANSLLAGTVYNSTPLTLANTQQASLQSDANGYLKVNVATPVVGLSQGSTTSGQTGSMVMGAVTTSAPSYTTAQTSPLSLDTGGGLRVSPAVASAWGVLAQNSATSGQTANLVMGAVTNAAPTYTPAQSSALSLTANGGGLRTDITTINANNVLTGNGATGTGSQRVTIASDSSARAVGGEGAVNSAAPSGAVMSGARSGANMVELTQASASVPINVSTATTTQLVALSGGTSIRVTSFDVIAGGTGNITFVYGTGTNCGTGTTSLTGAYPLTAQAGIAKGSGLGPVLVVPAGNALCVTTSAAVQMSGSVSYTQY